MEQVIPVWVHLFDELYFPFPRPMLDVFLPLHRVHEQRILFVKNQSAQPIAARKTFNRALRCSKARLPMSVVTQCRELHTGD